MLARVGIWHLFSPTFSLKFVFSFLAFSLRMFYGITNPVRYEPDISTTFAIPR